jgi:glycogen phosphorylase
MAENITSVLYPNDNTMAGKELRLIQQYFFVSATLQDIIRRFRKQENLGWEEFPSKVAIQLNDTHPTLGIVELQRLLIDEYGLKWDDAWDIVTRTFSFTNHTVLPEALEKWPVPLMQSLLPRHLQIILDINLFFLQRVEHKFPGEWQRLARMSLIEESPASQQIRMANLAIVGSHRVNGVAGLHTQLIKTTIFSDFVDFDGDQKFVNRTNGITPRRWLHQANPNLSELITHSLGSTDWLVNLDLLQSLKKKINDESFLSAWSQIKLENKRRLALQIEQRCEVKVDPEAMFDVQVKRIHEYKRQFMNILGVMYRYLQLKKKKSSGWVKKVVIFGGKAAPGYFIAKLVIKLILSVASTINSDSDTSSHLKVVFIPDYNVSLAEFIVPASDISQHISTAGTEASGTSNMKFVLNGGLLLGTFDGANIEIGEEIGEENWFCFGARSEQVSTLRSTNKYSI